MTDTAPLDAQAAHILLVEDNPGDVRLTQEAFERSSIQTTISVVTDGMDALDFLHQRGEYADAPRPDVVLLDLNLPRMNGEEVLEEIEASHTLRRIPVIVLTGSEAEEDILASYNRSANAYLTKPVDPDAFVETVRALETFWFSTVQLPPDGESP
ncbi:response regulator [Halobacteria archaeon AArc-dxtr1]|nr:response regulator [Halobacteria archaeon AArc-dxtr1]